MFARIAPRGARVFALAAATTALACGDARAPSTTPEPTAAPVTTATASAAPVTTATATASATTTASASAAPVVEAPYKPDNDVKPELASADLDAKGRAVLEAIAKNDPALGESFWFPRDAFTKVKDIKDPDAYWRQLHRTYAKDIEHFHKSKSSWEGAKYLRYEIGSKPTWVKPGEEGNKLGYWRTYRGHVVYEQDGKEQKLKVNVVISWQGRWFITHLDKIKR